MNRLTAFGVRLAGAISEKRSAVCVGLDPRWSSLPDTLKVGIDATDRAAMAGAIQCYCQEVIDAVAPVAAVVKPQAAFFEQLGPAGMQVLAKVVAHAQRCDLIVLMDAKRGDIGSTAEGYADAYLGAGSAWGCDALTVNPYLGQDTLEPFVQVADQRHAGLFVLVKTSNPGSGFLQDQPSEDGRKIYEVVADHVQDLACQAAGEVAYGNVGAVVGATYPEQLAELRQRMPNVWILIPGFGAQGGTAADVRHGFDAHGSGALVNSSRGIIFAYQQPRYAHLDWKTAVAQAAADMRSELADAIAGD